MRHIQALAIDDPQHFDDVASAKRPPRRQRLESVRDAVVVAYEEYIGATPEVAALPVVPLTADQREALLHAYSVETAPMTKLRGRLLSRVATARCPLCGIGEASTLDHYLPKEAYPQFAIFSRNLIPCCGPCNTRKSRLVLDEGENVRLFLHSYFDNIPEQTFLTVAINVLPDALGLTFRLVRPAGMTARTFEHLKSHFSRLRLGERYRLMSLEHLRDRYPALARFYGPGEDAERVAAELLQDADDLVDNHGSNHWRVVLYRALAADEAFCDGGFKVVTQIQ